MTDKPVVANFARESDLLEGIMETSIETRQAHQAFLLEDLSVESLEQFVSAVQPGAVLRNCQGQNVRVEHHVAMAGGPKVTRQLRDILWRSPNSTVFQTHRRYLHLHPFTDGNGRSARVIWLKLMLERELPFYKTFLRTWYYQSLEDFDHAHDMRMPGI